MANYVCGKNSCIELLKNKNLEIVYILDNHEFIKVVKDNKLNYKIVDKKYLDKLSNYKNHQGIVIKCKNSYKLVDYKDHLKKENGLILMLDGIVDPANFGSIIRTSECVGVDCIIYKKHDSCKVNETVARVASGALEYVNICEVTNLNTTIDDLKQKGYWIVGTSCNNALNYLDIDYKKNIVLIIGSEQKGISKLVEKNCDYLATIETNGKINSLNASVATGILLYNILDKRR